ncbi:MAG: hypothetical protein ACK58T_42445, partial [Phycisphaerae bacterium]
MIGRSEFQSGGITRLIFREKPDARDFLVQCEQVRDSVEKSFQPVIICPSVLQHVGFWRKIVSVSGLPFAPLFEVFTQVIFQSNMPQLNKYSSRITQPASQGASQAMLYATGLSTDDMQKPQVGIASVWYEG